ncbi:putative fatty acyl-CoA reductase CG5065 [Phlebotomus papatasi]|uniref:putative fatty acyl-CoA reductase CG5065 n=1 Tax=Phlebotomus papatasi TaxID=29031 RepID=UPI0024840426|nr:putative fatty acyl-CoA reductase CG5065 [Phlebotomus papatasi]XP_055699175.1 putative fatty acyl-CoA reductase CG5065 [Phlebotomus papatasi]
MDAETEIFMNNNTDDDRDFNSIREFYRDAVVFVTGGTGFLGKVLIEKLLFSCDDIRAIYVLLRSNRGLSSEQRFKEFIKNPVFDRVRARDPLALDKMTCIAGDINDASFGLDDSNMTKVVENVTMVFHVAATVKFNESLRDAACLNTLGTQRMMDLCCKMKKLKSVVHVSTAYSNPGLKYVGETVYATKGPLDKDTFIKCIKVLPKEIVDSFADRLQGTHPNTYTLTKSMAEEVVAEYTNKIPVCIVRPSIVTGSIKEPFPGWVDNVYGITGIMMEIGRGTISSIMCDQKCIMDLIPVDIVSNTLITAAWANVCNYKKSSITVYNCTSGQINPVIWYDYGRITEKWACRNPTKYVMLYPGFSYRTNRLVHKIVELFLHFLPAYIFDLILRAQGSKPLMMKIAKRFQAAANTGEFFAMHEWIFDNGNFRQLMRTVKEAKDGQEFNCDMTNMDWDSYVESYMLGIRQFVLKDGLESMKKARKKLNRLYWLKRFFQFGLVYLVYNFILKPILYRI